MRVEKTVKERVIAVIKEQLGLKPDQEVKDEEKLTKDLQMDELDSVEMVMSLEEEFGIEITDDEASSWDTVADVVQMMEKKDKEGR